MRKILAVGCLAIITLGPSTIASTPESTEHTLLSVWEQHFGAAPDDARNLLGDERVEPGWALALRGQEGDRRDDTVVAGDIWTVCLSAVGTCTWADVGGTFDPECDQTPVRDLVWIYTTIPAKLEVHGGPDDVATWSAFTINDAGTFSSGTITGTSCVVIDTGYAMVIRSDGVARFTGQV